MAHYFVLGVDRDPSSPVHMTPFISDSSRLACSMATIIEYAYGFQKLGKLTLLQSIECDRSHFIDLVVQYSD